MTLEKAQLNIVKKQGSRVGDFIICGYGGNDINHFSKNNEDETIYYRINKFLIKEKKIKNILEENTEITSKNINTYYNIYGDIENYTKNNNDAPKEIEK